MSFLRRSFLGLMAGVCFVSHAALAGVVDTARPYPNYKLFKQYQGENICWALAAMSIIKSKKGTVPLACSVVGTTLRRNCCVNGSGLDSACNKAGYIERALESHGISSVRSGVDFARAFNALKAGKLIGIVMDVSNAAFGSRAGHVAVIYTAERLSDGNYVFYVGDSSNGWYSFNTKHLKRLSNGKYEYLSLAISFEWEEMFIAG